MSDAGNDGSRIEELEAELQTARARLVETIESRDAAEARAEELQRDLDRRNETFRSGIGTLREVVFGDDLHRLILRLCLLLTDTERGAYLAHDEAAGPWRLRAAAGFPDDGPADFLTAVADRAAVAEQAVMLDDYEVAQLPDADLEEPVRNCLAAPVVILDEFDGVVVVADKRFGSFEEEDGRALLTIGDDASIAARNHRLQGTLNATYRSIVQTLAAVIQTQDAPTHDHSVHTAALAARTADRLGLDPPERAIVCYAALLHDIGKIGVDATILHKPGPLTEAEREVVRSHVAIGRDILRRVEALEDVADTVYRHHEWHDGSGYPDGIAGEEIPMTASVVAVVDAFSAMISRRAYKEAQSIEHARSELVQWSGRQFHPEVVDAFLAVLDETPFEEPPPGQGSPTTDICDLAPAIESRWEPRRARDSQRA